MEQGRKQWLGKGGVVGNALVNQHHDGVTFHQCKVANLCFVGGYEGRNEYCTFPCFLDTGVHVGSAFFWGEMSAYVHAFAFEAEQHDVAHSIVSASRNAYTTQRKETVVVMLLQPFPPRIAMYIFDHASELVVTVEDGDVVGRFEEGMLLENAWRERDGSAVGVMDGRGRGNGLGRETAFVVSGNIAEALWLDRTETLCRCWRESV